jgi:YVTN family beta-propeller protein
MKKHSLLALALAGIIYSAPSSPAGAEGIALNEPVGRKADGSVVLPVNQLITPTGTQVELPGLRPQVLALSPDGKLLVTSGKTREIVAIDPDTQAIVQTLALPPEGPAAANSTPNSSHFLKPSKEEQVSYTGLVFSPDGSRLFLSNVKGSIKVFAVGPDHHLSGLGSIPLPEAQAPQRKEEIPAGLAVSADGQRLYVAGNLSNRLLELELPSGRLLRSFAVGMLPYGVVLAGHKAYVSNWAGRRPEADSPVGPAGRGTFVRVDPLSHVASDGSVSVVDLEQGKTLLEIPTGLHASGLLLTPDQRHVCVANANSDTISVIDTRRDKVVEVIPTRWQAQDPFGAAPNALAMDRAGKTLFVCNGTQNAVAVISFRPGKSKLQGLIPVGWYPGAVVYNDERSEIYVANIKGTLPAPGANTATEGFNSHQHRGSLSLVHRPNSQELKEQTAQVLLNYRQALLSTVFQPARSNAVPCPVPERIGEPSVFKHVIYIVKENRTYDQVFGDITEGNGDPHLCVFGQKETPNQHKLVKEFVLLDNTYCSGILSADGHQWADSAFATDYMEKSFADFPRSYPDMQEEGDLDAVAYSPSGFIWDNALAHKKTFRDYGEGTVAVVRWKNPAQKKTPSFLDNYHDYLNHSGLITYSNYGTVESLSPHMMTNTVGWDLNVPDIFRAARFIGELRQFELTGKMPELITICLPNDHTSGTNPSAPTPAAQVADNDLAFGRIVEAVSHSRFWKDTCIFAIEDDPQSGWDHVSGYRTTGYVISPYTKRHTVVSVNYTQPSLLRTMELMLGLPPMNQMDATATPMSACFNDKPDFSPFESVTNNIPLDQMNPGAAEIQNRHQRHDAVVSSKLPLAKPDQCPDSVLNEIIWHAQKGFETPYPLWAISLKDED